MTPKIVIVVPVKFESILTSGVEIAIVSSSASAVPAIAKRIARRRQATHAPPERASEPLFRRCDEAGEEPDLDCQNQEGKQRAHLVAADVLPDARAELRPDDAADHQDDRQHRVDRIVGERVEHGRHGHGGDDLDERGADDDVGRNAQEVDERRHHDEAAADAEERAEKPMPMPRTTTGIALT